MNRKTGIVFLRPVGFLSVALLVFVSAAPARAERGEAERMVTERSELCPRPLPDGKAPLRRSLFGVRHSSSAPRHSTDSVVRHDFACNDDALGGTRQDGPSIASDTSGNFVIAWYEFRDGDADAWFQRFDADCSPQGRNERLNTDNTMGWQGDPAAAMASDGRFFFSWEDRRDIGNSDLFGQRFGADGRRLGDNFRVSDSGVPGDQSYSGCHIAPDGTILAAWDDRRFGITGDIFAQFIGPDGTPRDTNVRVNDDAVGRANQYEPAVSGDDSGRFVVAWMDGRGLNAYDWNIFGQRFDRYGNRLGINFQVTTNESIQWAPSVAAAPAGAFAVSWEDRRTGRYDAYAQFYDASGQPLGPNRRVDDDAGTAYQYSVRVGANRHGEYLVVWADERDGDADIYGQRFSASGAALGANFRVSDGPGGIVQRAPAVAARPDGGFFVVWVDRREGDDDLYCRALDRDGAPRGPSFRVNDDTASSHQRVSSIAMDTRGVSFVVWEDERNGNTDIFRAMFDGSGNELGPNLMLNDDGGGGEAQYYAAAAAGSGRYFAAWTDNRAGFNIYGQFLGGSGEPVGPNVRVNSDARYTFHWYPFCAMDTANRAAVVWMARRAEGYRIACRLYDAGGNPHGPEFEVADDSANQYYASVAKNRNGLFAVAWMDYRGGEADIYCRVFGADGTPRSGNVKVNTDAGTAYQGYPACAASDDGRVAVAWEDTRNRRYDVFLQWFDSTGARLGDNEPVNDNPTETDCYSPSCAFDAQGRLAVMFNDEREVPGLPGIFVQRFRPDRTRISGNQRFSSPAAFPKNSHWTVGQSVAAGDERVVCAWTDNRRSRGWDIFAKVTDWELVSVREPRTPRSTDKPGFWVLPTVSDGRFVLYIVPGLLPGFVSVFDRAGRQVHAEEVRETEHVVAPAGLRPGVYFCRFESGAMHFNRKMIVR